MLRNERQFRLMRDYAAAVIESGTSDFEVRRQYGQVLIELKEVDAAVDVLRALAAATPKGHKRTTKLVASSGAPTSSATSTQAPMPSLSG